MNNSFISLSKGIAIWFGDLAPILRFEVKKSVKLIANWVESIYDKRLNLNRVYQIGVFGVFS